MQQDKLIQAILKQDFSSFINKAFHTINPGNAYEANWHIDLIADYLEAVRKGEITRLIINMPPRALKSVCISVAWPAWLLGHQPHLRILNASYSSMLSIKHSLDCRQVMSAKWYRALFPRTRLSKAHNQKSKFLTTANGFRLATSVGGSVTGEGGDVLIIDDPHNPTHIHSIKNRQKAILWFEQSFFSRLNDKRKGAIVLVMQRLHTDDLTAHLLNSGNWQLLTLPAVADVEYKYDINNHQYTYPPGQLLHDQRDSSEFLDNICREIGAKNYAAQFMQQPLPAEIALLKTEDIHFYNEEPTCFEYYVHSWDTAIKTSQTADYTVGTCWGVYQDKYYLVNLLRQKLMYPDLKQQVTNWLRKYQPRFVLIEDKASGQSLIQDLQLENYHNIVPIKTKLDKITRFASAIPMFQNGLVKLPKISSFNQNLLQELTNFPNSKNDDIVDSVSQFLNFIKKNPVTAASIKLL